MSYTEEQLHALLDQSYSMPYGPGQIALVEQVVRHADAQRFTRLAFDARMHGTQAYVYGGEPSRSFATFAWCLAEFDRDPVTYQRHQRNLLWHFKFMVSALTKFPEISIDRTYEVLDDMQRRWQETGHSMQAVHAYRHRVARHIGDLDAAERYYAQWCAAPRDDLSDCSGCDPSGKAYWLYLRGRDEEAVALGDPVLSGRLTCSEQPQDMLATLMVPYLRTGRLDQARDAHRHAYRLHRPNLADLGSIADHIEFCARTGNQARAVEMVERHLGWLDRAPSPWVAMVFAAASSLALRRAQEQPGPTLTVHRPGHGDRAASRAEAAELSAELAAQATELAARFDRRNGTDRVGTLVRGLLDAQPWIEYLPLSPTERRRATTLPARSDPSTVEEIFAKRAPSRTSSAEPRVEPGTVPPTGSLTKPATGPATGPTAGPPRAEPVPETSGPDELLDSIEAWYDEDRDDEAASALDVFDARYAGRDLTVSQRARVADARGLRLAMADEEDGAIALWREAVAGYAQASNVDGEQRALARVGAALCRIGRREEGLPLLVEATDRLLATNDHKARVDAVIRLAGCYLALDDPQAALATLDRPEASPADAPPRSAATHAAMRVQALFNLQRGDEVCQSGPAAIALAEAAQMPDTVARLHVGLALCLEHAGELLAAADHLASAIPLIAEPQVRSGLRRARANQLARTERASEAIDDLVEAVADSTARGAVDEAADARHSLAIAYLNTGRPLDAAEIAEEELAYRLSVDERPNEADRRSNGPASALPVRHLLATIYERLGQTDDAVAQLDAIADVHTSLGERAEAGQVASEAGEVLDKADRDGDAATRFLVAADVYAELGRHLPELYNRRRHALSLHWVQHTEQAVAALRAADALVPHLDGEDAQWELARLHYDAARILRAAGELAEAAARAGRSAEVLAELRAPGPASDARLLQARILLERGDAAAAEAAARGALQERPDVEGRRSGVEVLDAALRRQGRDEEADLVWTEHGLDQPSTRDEQS